MSPQWIEETHEYSNRAIDCYHGYDIEMYFSYSAISRNTIFPSFKLAPNHPVMNNPFVIRLKIKFYLLTIGIIKKITKDVKYTHSSILLDLILKKLFTILWTDEDFWRLLFEQFGRIFGIFPSFLLTNQLRVDMILTRSAWSLLIWAAALLE